MSRNLSFSCVRTIGTILVVFCHSAGAQQPPDPHKLLDEGDRLAWLRSWTRAAPVYAEAERLFAARGDRRNALYAQISTLRGELPRLPVPDVSQRLAEYLEDPVVQGDDRLRLRCLIVKAETDEDLDPSLSERSWLEALRLAEKLGESGWANRARGELGLVAFLLGDVSSSVIKLGQALKTAEANGDVASVVRWLTLFGHGYVELGRPEQALDFYERALKIASTVPELHFPLMTHVGRGNALARTGRHDEAERVLDDALTVATREGALGYQAELLVRQALIAYERKETERAIDSLARARDLAQRAGGNRILAGIALELARIQRETGRAADAARTLQEGITLARTMGERLLLPRLLAQLADLHVAQRRYADAAELLVESSDLLEGLLTSASSPWVRSRVINGMDDVFLARIRLEGTQSKDPARLFAVLERAKGRSLLELLLSGPVASGDRSAELRAGERRIAALQLQLLRATGLAERERLLNQIFVAEEQLAPAATELFNRTRSTARKPVSLSSLQARLRSDEVLLEFALAEPNSFVIVVTRSAARTHRIAGQTAIQRMLEPFFKDVEGGGDVRAAARRVGDVLLDGLPELANHPRLLVSPDGDLHRLPFELLETASGRLLESHVVTYVPSGSVLAILRDRRPPPGRRQAAVAVSASPDAGEGRVANGSPTVFGTIERSVYGLDSGQLPPLPSANDEARAVAAALGQTRSTVLVGDAATESAVKNLPLDEYAVVHFAVHGILSTRFPARSALVLRPGGTDDGLLQAREILMLRVGAELVTLSACDSGTGTVHGREGVASLVRPFFAAGAQTVVANLWTADDRFSLALMREFYRQIGAGTDIADALRQAKLKMLSQYGPRAIPRLWSGVLAYGDGAGKVPGAAGR